ncbi:PAS domain-containing sensor histidine kinase [Hymenobacter koreensis]|uniref:histidine kinase n=1 Tax=Hymenobacter koreensis TaxID=1084523 RepID=A0ABP8JJA7_9BACT
MLETEPSFQELVENFRQVFFVYDLSANRLVYVNSAYERVMGGRSSQANEELPGLLRQLHPDDRAYAAECLEKLLQQRLHEDVEVRLVRPDGSVQWLCLKAAVQQRPNGQALLSGFVEDVTTSKEYTRNAERFNNKKNSTLEILSHDLAGPLNIIRSAAVEVRARTQQHTDPVVQELVRIIEETCREGTDLIHDFVDNEFYESVNVELRRERVNLVERLGITIDNYRHMQLGLKMDFQLHTSAPAIYLHIDENKMMQVFNNLISNSLKFTPDGGQIRVDITEHPEHVRVVVSDTGIGIPLELQPELFEKFTKARRPGLRGEKATGLGMSIIQTIIRLHQGRIWVESAEGQGTAFHIELPKSVPAH